MVGACSLRLAPSDDGTSGGDLPHPCCLRGDGCRPRSTEDGDPIPKFRSRSSLCPHPGRSGGRMGRRSSTQRTESTDKTRKVEYAADSIMLSRFDHPMQSTSHDVASTPLYVEMDPTPADSDHLLDA